MNAAALLTSQSLLLAFLMMAMLWKGGKALDATWLLVPVAVVCAWAAGAQTQRREGLSQWAWWSGIIFLALSLASFVQSRTANYGLDELLRDGSVFLLLAWAVRHGQRATVVGRSFHERFLTVLWIGGVAACLIGVAVYALQPVNRFVGTFFDHRFHTDYWPNAWAELLLLTWPAALYHLRAARGAQCFARALATGLMLGCLILSYSRGGMIMALGQVMLWLILWACWAQRHLRRKALPQTLRACGMAVVAIGLSAACTFVASNALRSMVHPVQSLREKVVFQADEGLSSVSERSDFFRQSWELSWQRPLLGWGPYAFRFVQPRLQTGVLATSDHPHNVFLKAAMERGWPAALSLLSLLLACLLPFCVRIVWRRDVHPLSPAAVSLVGVAGVLAHNLMDYNLQFVGIVVPFWVSVGLVASAVPVGRGGAARSVIERSLAILLLCVALMEGRALVYSSLARRAEARGAPRQALEWYAKATPSLFPRDANLSRTYVLLEQGDTTAALDAIHAYRERNPEDLRGWKAQGAVFAAMGQHGYALASYRAAWPAATYNDLGVLVGYLRSAAAAGNRRDIDGNVETIEAVLRSYVAAIRVNAHFIALSSNVEEFLRAIDEMQRFFPQRAATYAAWIVDVEEQATRVRAELQARPRGYLW